MLPRKHAAPKYASQGGQIDDGFKDKAHLVIPRGSTPLGRIVEHLAWLASGKGVGAVLSLFYLAIVTRTLGPADFGRFALIVSAATAINTIVGFNFWQVVVKYGQSYIRDRDGAGLGRLLAFCAATDLCAGLTGCAIAALSTLVLGKAIGIPDRLAMQAFCFAAVLMLTIRSTPIGVLRLLNRFNTAAVSETMIPIVRMVGALVVLFTQPSIPAFLLAWAAAEIACATAYWMFAWHAVHRDMGQLSFRQFWRPWAEVDGLRGFMFVTNITSTLAAVSSQAPVLMVGAFAGPAGAGFYRLSAQLAQAMTKMSGLFSRSLYSELAHVHANHGRAELRALFRKTCFITLGAALVSALAILLAGKPILLTMSGPEYIAAYPLLAILGVGSAIGLAGVGFEPLLMATNGARQSLSLRIVTTLILFGALAALLPTYGAIGAACAVLIAAVANFLLLGEATFRQLRA
ncbi:oligosaccharide flippase family protein [soil metagenome]